jgi:hypothetical protein
MHYVSSLMAADSGRAKLYTDDDEFRVQGSRSIILTGLTNCITRPDLNSRTVMLALQPIKDDAVSPRWNSGRGSTKHIRSSSEPYSMRSHTD